MIRNEIILFIAIERPEQLIRDPNNWDDEDFYRPRWFLVHGF